MQRGQVMLDLNTEVERRLSLSILSPLLVCAILVVFGVAAAARLEFTYSAWVKKAHYLPAITEAFRNLYRCGWGLPVSLVLWSVALVRKPSCKLGALVFLVGTAVVALTGWVLFALLSFYLCNQTFIVQS